MAQLIAHGFQQHPLYLILYTSLEDLLGSVWLYALGSLALYWVECQNPRILILRLNANISVWMFRYSEPRHDIEVECQMLFGCQSEELQL